MKNIQITLNKWNDFYYGLYPQIITNIAITNAVVAFTDHLKNNNLSKDSKILIQFKIKIEENNYRSISILQTINFNKNEIDELIDVFIGFWEFRDEGYHCLNPSYIVFTFKILSDDLEKENIKIKFNKIKINESLKTVNFKGYNLPYIMDYEKWGEIIEEEYGNIIIKKCNSKFYYHINIFNNNYEVKKIKDKILL